MNERITSNYNYLKELDKDLTKILGDTRKHKEKALVKRTCEELRSQGEHLDT